MTTATDTKRPLPSPPGPNFLQSFQAFGRDAADAMHQVFLRYGEVSCWNGIFRVYLMNNPEHVKQILTQSYPAFTKDLMDYRIVGHTLGLGLVTSDGDFWKKQRRLMQPMFHNKVVNAFDAIINDLTAALAKGWDKVGPNDPIALERDMSRVTFQIVTATLFGSEIDEHAGEMVEFLDVININTKSLNAILSQVPWLPTPHNLRFKRIIERLDGIVYKVINGRRAHGIGNADLLDRLLSARDEDTGEGMEERQIRDEVVTLMLAGHETSSTALQWTIYALSQHPEIEAELFNELDAALNGNPATAADLSRLPYLKQVVQESMRLYPPVWGIARKSAEDHEFGGYRVPAGAYLSIMPYSLHRHPEHWPDPERFDPNRFNPQRNESRHSYCYIPFSAGPRTCIGAGMSMLEIQLILAQLLQRFRIRPVPGHPVVPLATVTYRPRYGMKVTIERRKGVD